MKRRSQTSSQPLHPPKASKLNPHPEMSLPNKSRTTHKNKNNTLHQSRPQNEKQKQLQRYSQYNLNGNTKNSPTNIQNVSGLKKNPVKKSKKKIQDYVMINGNIYKADTQTQRLQVNYFVNRIKKQAIQDYNSHSQQSSISIFKNPAQISRHQSKNNYTVPGQDMQVEELVKNLPLEQKLSIMRQLEKEFSHNNPQFFINEPKQQQLSTEISKQKQKQKAIQKTKQKQIQKNPQQSSKQKKQTQAPTIYTSAQNTSPELPQDTKKYNILNLKLTNLELQLNNKRETQIQKINKLFYEGQLTASQRKNKIFGIDKVKDRKIKIINCTRNLFYTLLNNKFEPEFFRTSQNSGNSSFVEIQDAMRELDSISDFDTGNQPQSTVTKTNAISTNVPHNGYTLNLGKSFNLKQQFNPGYISTGLEEKISIKDIQNINNINGSINNNKPSHKNVIQNNLKASDKNILYEKHEDRQEQQQSQLQNQFHTQQQFDQQLLGPLEEAEGEKQGNLQNYKKIDNCIETSDKKSLGQQSLLLSPDKSAEKQKQRQKQKQKQKDKDKDKEKNKFRSDQTDKFECTQQSLPLSRRLQIPLLMTKQKMQQMQWQKKTKLAQKMRTQIQKKISFQMGQLQLQPQYLEIGHSHQTQQNNLKYPHFTTLADINGYIVALYEYVIRKDLRYAVQKLNIAYGKPILQKLYYLQEMGQIDNIEYQSVLNQSHFNGFNTETALTVRRLSDYQKIHSKAVFDSFNMHLNAYRPYFDLDGQVYPWYVSEKGLTFYEINEQNIQQVFQKTKIKVLQQSSTLCGILPFNVDPAQLPEPIKQKNNETFQKEQKLSLIENFNQWNLKVYDFDTMVRLLLGQEILIKEVMDFLDEWNNLGSH